MSIKMGFPLRYQTWQEYSQSYQNVLRDSENTEKEINLEVHSGQSPL